MIVGQRFLDVWRGLYKSIIPYGMEDELQFPKIYGTIAAT
jgi:hypothetical protein